jgi:hypothetical protein
LAIAQWKVGYEEPIYLVTNMELAEEACHWYAKYTDAQIHTYLK